MFWIENNRLKELENQIEKQKKLLEAIMEYFKIDYHFQNTYVIKKKEEK